MGKTVAIILAGGSGKRLRVKMPKQFVKLGDRPMITYSLEKFSKNGVISDIIVVCHKAHIKRLKRIIKKYNIRKVTGIFPGGNTRQRSSYIGLKNCPVDTGYVLIHDAARPFVTDNMIKSVLKAAKKTGAAAPGVNAGDTVIRMTGGYVKKVLKRDETGLVQTPQGFDYSSILLAHIKSAKMKRHDFTDDCGLIVAMKKDVSIVRGSAVNIKVTDKKDLLLAEALCRKQW